MFSSAFFKWNCIKIIEGFRVLAVGQRHPNDEYNVNDLQVQVCTDIRSLGESVGQSEGNHSKQHAQSSGHMGQTLFGMG